MEKRLTAFACMVVLVLAASVSGTARGSTLPGQLTAASGVHGTITTNMTPTGAVRHVRVRSVRAFIAEVARDQRVSSAFLPNITPGAQYWNFQGVVSGGAPAIGPCNYWGSLRYSEQPLNSISASQDSTRYIATGFGSCSGGAGSFDYRCSNSVSNITVYSNGGYTRPISTLGVNGSCTSSYYVTINASTY